MATVRHPDICASGIDLYGFRIRPFRIRTCVHTPNVIVDGRYLPGVLIRVVYAHPSPRWTLSRYIEVLAVGSDIHGARNMARVFVNIKGHKPVGIHVIHPYPGVVGRTVYEAPILWDIELVTR